MQKDSKNPKRLIRIALILVGVHLLCHLFGMREMTSILSGTMPAAEHEVFLGLFYVLTWFGAVLLAPILGLAGALHLGLVEVLAALSMRRPSEAKNRSHQVEGVAQSPRESAQPSGSRV